tara:strand:- start:8677 stop:8967 length:291 start_codon:yes stop_codon:yes gene_type:complete
VFKLSQLYLQLAFVRTCALRKNIENDSRAIQHATLEFALNISLLPGAECMIEKNNISFMQRYRIPDFLKLAFSYEQPGGWLFAGSGYRANRFNSSR